MIRKPFLLFIRPVKTFYGSMNIGYRNYGKNTLFRMVFCQALCKNDFLFGGYTSLGFG
jgi:hypothetical protein